MDTPLTPARLAEIRARVEAVDAETWDEARLEYYTQTRHYSACVVDGSRLMHANLTPLRESVEQANADRVFVAHAPADLRALLAHVDALTAENTRLRTQGCFPLPQANPGGSLDLLRGQAWRETPPRTLLTDPEDEARLARAALPYQRTRERAMIAEVVGE